MQESKVAPPQDSKDQKPTLSSFSAMGSMSSSRMRVASRDWWASRRITSVIPSGFFVSVIVSAFCLKVLIYLPGHFLWRDRYCAIAFLIASAVSGSTDDGAEGLARGVRAGAAGSGGPNRWTSFDMSRVANTNMIRNTKTNPMPATIRSMACDISSLITNSYLY